jgi:hypothetical protein
LFISIFQKIYFLFLLSHKIHIYNILTDVLQHFLIIFSPQTIKLMISRSELLFILHYIHVNFFCHQRTDVFCIFMHLFYVILHTIQCPKSILLLTRSQIFKTLYYWNTSLIINRLQNVYNFLVVYCLVLYKWIRTHRISKQTYFHKPVSLQYTHMFKLVKPIQQWRIDNIHNYQVLFHFLFCKLDVLIPLKIQLFWIPSFPWYTFPTCGNVPRNQFYMQSFSFFRITQQIIHNRLFIRSLIHLQYIFYYLFSDIFIFQ